MASRDPGGTKCSETWTASTAGVMALSESFLKPLVNGDQKAPLAGVSPYLRLYRRSESLLLGVLL